MNPVLAVALHGMQSDMARMDQVAMNLANAQTVGYKRGVFAKRFGGGQVDIANGDFVFSLTESYLVEDGKITAPLKGVNLIGNGPDVLRKVSMLGHDVETSDGIWTCGKDGQSVPVGVGCPTIKISAITVGGTKI